MDPDRPIADDVESVALAPTQEAAPVDSRPISSNQEGEAGQAFYQIMNDWFTQYIRTNPAAQQPPPLTNPSSMPAVHQVSDPLRLYKPPVDKIRKHGAEEFKANNDDDAERAVIWLDNTIHVFNELSCTPDECLKCAISLL
ncbi:hypothetical protein PVK06_048382 [Gossypium arboreum]|uniref:Chaperone surA n=1 Tax=Gossypium arboreum TaxID=29729 RepID=A0ABR0MFT2_GOSAR|nr:hypothetical protein PVK06_048382 [Gossypium arboreum]